MTRTTDPRWLQDGGAPIALYPGQYLIVPPQTRRERGETLHLLRQARRLGHQQAWQQARQKEIPMEGHNDDTTTARMLIIGPKGLEDPNAILRLIRQLGTEERVIPPRRRGWLLAGLGL